VCLVHPDRALAALDDVGLRRYRAARDARERQRLRDELAVSKGPARPCASARKRPSGSPSDTAYAGFDAEQAVLLDAASRRLDDDGPIVAGGVAEGLAGPEAEQAGPSEV
jgi:hypothetical protein